MLLQSVLPTFLYSYTTVRKGLANEDQHSQHVQGMALSQQAL